MANIILVQSLLILNSCLNKFFSTEMFAINDNLFKTIVNI